MCWVADALSPPSAIPATAAGRTPDDVMEGTETRGPAADECLGMSGCWFVLLLLEIYLIFTSGRMVGLCRDLELAQLMGSADSLNELAADGRLPVAGRGASDLDCCFFYTRPCGGWTRLSVP